MIQRQVTAINSRALNRCSRWQAVTRPRFHEAATHLGASGGSGALLGRDCMRLMGSGLGLNTSFNKARSLSEICNEKHSADHHSFRQQGRHRGLTLIEYSLATYSFICWKRWSMWAWNGIRDSGAFSRCNSRPFSKSSSWKGIQMALKLRSDSSI